MFLMRPERTSWSRSFQWPVAPGGYQPPASSVAAGAPDARGDHAPEVLPGLLEGRGQEGRRADEQLEAAAQPLVDSGEDPTPEGVRQSAGDRSQAGEGGLAALLGDLALDGRPEEV